MARTRAAAQRINWHTRVSVMANTAAAVIGRPAGPRDYVRALADALAADHSAALADNAARDSAARIHAQMATTRR